MDTFINILQFLTRIKVKKDVTFQSNMANGIVYFPIVGAIIGLIMVLVYLITSLFIINSFSHVLIAVIVLIAEVVITGGLHIDGFGDTFDGIFSYKSKDEILEIMKDPRLGTNGLLAIVFLIITKVFVLSIFIKNHCIWPIFIMPIVGRYVAVILTYKTEPAKSKGMGNPFIGKCDLGTLLICTGTTALLTLIFSLIFSGSFLMALLSLISLVIIFIFSISFEIGVYRKIGGITGDILGCGIELGEIIFIIYILLIFSGSMK